MDTNYPYAAHFATGTPGMYTTQTAQETAQKDAAKSAITIHDLSTSTAREGEAYNALTDHRGRAVDSNPRLDAQMRAHIQQHRGRIADINDERTSAWNDPVLFEDGHDGLENMYDGQSHRYQTHAGRSLFDAPPVNPAHAAMSAEPTAGLQRSIHATSPGRGGHGASPRAGPTTDPTAGLQRSKHASAPVRGGRGASPRPGPATQATAKAQRSQPAPTPVRRGRETSSRPGPAPKSTAKAQRSKPATTRPRAYSPTAAGTIRDHGGIRQQLPPLPRHQGRAQAASTFPQNSQSGNQSYTLPTQPSAPASLASIPVGHGAAVNSGKDSEESDDQGFEPTHQPKDEHEVDPHKVYAIYELARSDVLSAIVRKKFDGPAISTAKVFLADAAIQSSKPSNEVLNKGPQWVELFHAVRRLFVNKAFDIYELPHRPSHVEIARMTADFTQYRKLMQDIYQAKTMAKHVNPVMRAQWAENNKLDVLEEAVRRYYSQPAATTTITPAIIITPPSEASSPTEPTPINSDLLGPPVVRNGSRGPYLASTGVCNLRLFSGGQQLTMKGEDWVPHVVPSGMKVTIDCELHQELLNDSKYRHVGEAYTAALGSVSEILLSAIQLRKPEPLLARDDDDEEL